MQTALMIIHVIVSLALIVVVLMQHGKQQGLSGAIAGGAETFFGKNKGRTVDAMLRKVTAVIAALFIVLSVVLAVISINTLKPAEADVTSPESQSQQITVDENGNLVDQNGQLILDENGNPTNINEAAAQAEDSEASTDANTNADAVTPAE